MILHLSLWFGACVYVSTALQSQLQCWIDWHFLSSLVRYPKMFWWWLHGFWMHSMTASMLCHLDDMAEQHCIKMCFEIKWWWWWWRHRSCDNLLYYL